MVKWLGGAIHDREINSRFNSALTAPFRRLGMVVVRTSLSKRCPFGQQIVHPEELLQECFGVYKNLTVRSSFRQVRDDLVTVQKSTKIVNDRR